MKTYFELQKDLCDVSRMAFEWINVRLLKGEFPDDGRKWEMEIARERIHWARGGFALANFAEGRSIFPEGFADMDVWSAHAVFGNLRRPKGENLTWAWTSSLMVGNSHPDKAFSIIPLVAALAEMDVVHKGVSPNDLYHPVPGSELMVRIAHHRERIERRFGEGAAGNIGVNDQPCVDHIKALEREQLLCDHGDKPRRYASAVNGFGVGPYSYSLFAAMSLAHRVLDLYQIEDRGPNDEGLSMLIREISICLARLEKAHDANSAGLGKELLNKIADRENRKRAEAAEREAKLLKAQGRDVDVESVPVRPIE